MTLRSQARLDILRAAQRDALIHAEVWIGIAKHLEDEIGTEPKEEGFNRPWIPYGVDTSQWDRSLGWGEGYSLSRSRASGDNEVRNTDDQC